LVSFLDSRSKEEHMIIVAGHLLVKPEEREHYLHGCVSVVEQARSSPEGRRRPHPRSAHPGPLQRQRAHFVPT
jgi:hypothetical protein